MRQERLSTFLRKVSFPLTPENAETQSWVMKTVRQRIPGQRAHKSKTPTTITVQSIMRNDYLPLTGGSQMMMTGDVSCLYATVHQGRTVVKLRMWTIFCRLCIFMTWLQVTGLLSSRRWQCSFVISSSSCRVICEILLWGGWWEFVVQCER